MSSYYRPELPGPKSGKSDVWFDRDSPGFNGYFKWHKTTYGTNPSFNSKGLNAPADWGMPKDWTYSDSTGHWYTPAEMTNAGFNQIDGQWLHPNDIRKQEIDTANAELDAKIASRKATEGRMRKVHAFGRKKTILTGPVGATGVVKVEKHFLQNSKGVMQ
ncbi:aminobutyrate aminotransferase [Maridesulfovibrio ferrireducens]|uniref:aminobutyrate aminotransferase n=1 Tax=Maridesulfovibrio ferrireducens TaxID=246191 RepID=UPI001A22EAC1|nr:aminobutyrate aminotransferase [Maridesulfovibrio ferrireducens]MBI9112814.1 aminobutyrate aminotransferase [Maridesulfovibrio ferrireducens]